MFSRLFSGLTRNRENPPHGRERLSLENQQAVLYAIGDIHGCFDLLLKIEEVIGADGARFPDQEKVIVLLGDLIDRGPQSAEVLQHVLGPPPRGFRRIVLAGNHEAEMLAFLANPTGSHHWLDLGGIETLASYGVPAGRQPLGRSARSELALRAGASIPEEHIAFLRRLPVALRWGRYALVHAGIRPHVPFELQSDGDLLDIRRAFTASVADHGLIIVHGHTPTPEPERLPNRIGLDIAAYATGRLAAARLDGPNVEFLIVR